MRLRKEIAGKMEAEFGRYVGFFRRHGISPQEFDAREGS